MTLLFNKKMMDPDPDYGYARDLDDIEAASSGDLDVTDLTENALRETDDDHTEVSEAEGSKIYNHDDVLTIVPGRHAAVKAAKDAYDDAARAEVVESVVGE